MKSWYCEISSPPSMRSSPKKAAPLPLTFFRSASVKTEIRRAVRGRPLFKGEHHDYHIRTLAAPAPDARIYPNRACPNHGCDPPGSLRMGARQMPRDPPSDPACPILSGVDRLSVGADGVRCPLPPEALPDTFCLL